MQQEAETTEAATVRVLLLRPSGAEYIYDVPRKWKPDPDLPESHHWAQHWGTLVAHKTGDIWFEGAGWRRVFPNTRVEEILASIPADHIIGVGA